MANGTLGPRCGDHDGVTSAAVLYPLDKQQGLPPSPHSTLSPRLLWALATPGPALLLQLLDDKCQLPVTVGAAISPQVVVHAVAETAHDNLAAPGAGSILITRTRHVADVDIAQTFLVTDLRSSQQRFAWCGTHVHQFVVGVKARDVPGHVWADAGNEMRQITQLTGAVVLTGNNERGDLNPDAGLVHEANGIQHRLEPAPHSFR